MRELAWDIPTSNLYAAYAAVQAYTDQAISADTYITPNRYPNGKVPLSVLMKEFVMQAKLGIKTLYYVNTNDVQKSFHDTAAEEGCDTCKM